MNTNPKSPKGYVITYTQINQVKQSNPKLKLPSPGTYIPIGKGKYKNLQSGEIVTRRILNNARYGVSQEERLSQETPATLFTVNNFTESKSSHFIYIDKDNSSITKSVQYAFSKHPKANSYFFRIEYTLNNLDEKIFQTETLDKREVIRSEVLFESYLDQLFSQYSVGQITNVYIGIIQR